MPVATSTPAPPAHARPRDAGGPAEPVAEEAATQDAEPAGTAPQPPAGGAGGPGEPGRGTRGGGAAELVAVPTPGGAGPEAAVFTGRLDGAEVSVGVQPGAQAGRPVVLLRVSSPLLDTVAGAYLTPAEADRLAAALSAAAFTAACQTSGPCAPPAGAAVAGCHGPVPAGHPGHSEITAVEGTPAAELSAAIADLPADAVLVDFTSDADVCLIFDFPAPRSNQDTTPPPHSRPGGPPAGQRPAPPAAA